jgi:hypothetical protein
MGGYLFAETCGKKLDGSFVYALIAGEMNGSIFENGRIDDKDYYSVIPDNNIWQYNLFNGYLVGDMNMDGIITTRDFNISFNNRNRVSAIRNEIIISILSLFFLSLIPSNLRC